VDGPTQRLIQLARDGDADAWLDLARLNTRRGVATSFELLVTPWAGRDDILRVCAQALREGHALTAASLVVRPHRRGQGVRGFECLREGEVSDRWWGGLGAEDHAARWLYDAWLRGGRGVEEADVAVSNKEPALGARVLKLERVGCDGRQSGQFREDTLE